MSDLVSTALQIINELKEALKDVNANEQRCKRLVSRLLALKPALEAFQAQAESDASNRALAETICTLVKDINQYVSNFRKYEGKGPKIAGRSVTDFAIKLYNRGDDKKAFVRFNFEISEFSATVALRANAKALALDTRQWRSEDAQDEQVDSQSLQAAIAELGKQTAAL